MEVQLLWSREVQGGVGLAGHRHGHRYFGVGLGALGNPAIVDGVKLMVSNSSFLKVFTGAQTEVTETTSPNLQTTEVSISRFFFRFSFLLFQTHPFKMTFPLTP